MPRQSSAMNKQSCILAMLVVLGTAPLGCDIGLPEPKAHEAEPARPSNTKLVEDGGIEIDEKSRPYVVVEAVGAENAAVTLRAPARVAFRDSAISRVGAPIPARVMKLHVKVGDKVKINDRLATLASPDASGYHAELARARVELSAAKSALTRQEEMLAKGVGREYEKVTAEMAVRAAEERVRGAKRDVGLLGKSYGGTVIVTSQIEGTVLRRNASVGAQVDPEGDPLFEIGNPKDLWVVADVFQDDLGMIQPGADVTLDLAAMSEPVQGKVLSIGVLLDTAVRRAPVYVELDASTRDSLRAGMFARALISASAIDGLTVPTDAVLIKDGDKTIVYVERSVGVFEPREVELGHGFENRVEIVSGLHAGERVAMKGALLIDGAANQLL
jgi:cobalt-zinc-cadmium efflux system membrane fusion protein